MEIKDFVKLFGEQFDDTPPEAFTTETKFRELEEWDSLTALSVIAMIDEEFDKQITGADIRSVSTIEELYNHLKKR